MIVHRHPAPVILHLDRIVGQDPYVNMFAVTSQRLVDAVVYNLINQVVQPARTRAADIHTRPQPDRFESLQNLYLLRIIPLLFNISRHTTYSFFP
jgi:hypothetical protein